MKVQKSVWKNTEFVKAMAYDTPVTGYSTFNTNCLRLWSALPSFDAQCKDKHC
jgi:starch phosphorylase